MRTAFVLVSVICAASLAPCRAGQKPLSERLRDVTTMIASAETEAIALLSDASRMKKDPKSALAAIDFLGHIRSRKAVPVLVERLLHERRFLDPVGDRLRFPASKALVEIGRPAVEGLLRRIADAPTSREYRDVSVGILVDLVGPDKVIGTIDGFKTAKDKEKRAQQRERLDALKEQFKKLYQLDKIS